MSLTRMTYLTLDRQYYHPQIIRDYCYLLWNFGHLSNWRLSLKTWSETSLGEWSRTVHWPGCNCTHRYLKNFLGIRIEKKCWRFGVAPVFRFRSRRLRCVSFSQRRLFCIVRPRSWQKFNENAVTTRRKFMPPPTPLPVADLVLMFNEIVPVNSSGQV
jgi:hypothetical protein